MVVDVTLVVDACVVVFRSTFNGYSSVIRFSDGTGNTSSLFIPPGRSSKFLTIANDMVWVVLGEAGGVKEILFRCDRGIFLIRWTSVFFLILVVVNTEYLLATIVCTVLSLALLSSLC